jgi:hypothetical protein
MLPPRRRDRDDRRQHAGPVRLEAIDAGRPDVSPDAQFQLQHAHYQKYYPEAD